MADLDNLMKANLLDVFGERDASRRRAAIARTYTDDVVFADAEDSITGHEALDAKAQGILDGAPGLSFRPVGEVLRVDDMGYLAWELGVEGGDAVVRGADMGFVRDGLLAKVYTVLFR